MTGRFSREEVIDYLENTASQTLLKKFEELRSETPDYECLLQLLDGSKKQHPFSRTQLDETYRKLRIAERNEFLVRFYSGNMTPEDNYILINELNSPTSKMLDSMLDDLQMGSDESISLYAGTLLSEGEVLQVVTGSATGASRESDAYKTEAAAGHDSPVRLPSGPDGAKDSFDWLSWLKPATGLAFAALLVGLLTPSTISYFRTTYKINQASTLLQTNYRILYDGVPRLSGNYGPKGRGEVLGDRDAPDEVLQHTPGEPALLIQDTKMLYLREAMTQTQQALHNGADLNEVRLLQAQIFFMNGQVNQAAWFLQQLDAAAAESPEAQNTRGLIAFSQEQWQRAVDLFKAATGKDSELRVGYYNLALAYQKLGQKEDAISAIERYLAVETDDGWLRSARALQKNLKKD